MKTFPLRLDDDLHKQLRHAAIEADVSLHQWILRAIEAKLDDENGRADERDREEKRR